MKKLLAVILALIMVVSFTACGKDKKNQSGNESSDITTSIVSNDDYDDEVSSEESEEVTSDNEEDNVQDEEIVVDDQNNEENQNGEENAQQEDKTIKKMYSSKKDLKSNAHFILYSDGTWSYQSDSVSLVISDEDDIKDIKNRIENGELFVITEGDLNNVAAG